MKHFLSSEHVYCLVAAHNEALKKELQRLLYQQQQQQHQLPPLSPPGYELQRQQFSMLDLGSQQQQQQQPQLRPLSPIP
jgi:hypothetical protein